MNNFKLKNKDMYYKTNGFHSIDSKVLLDFWSFQKKKKVYQ